MADSWAACTVYDAGIVPYEESWRFQQKLAGERGKAIRNDLLLLLQHPHTYTLGSAGKLEHLLMSETERHARGVAVHHVDRGGDITYHGPGQLVGYPIMQLPAGTGAIRADVVAYVRNLEQVLIDALSTFGIHAERLPGYSGVWVRTHNDALAKIAAIGVKVTVHRVTYHGFALNVNTDMTFFDGIIPCGIDDKPVISMQQYCGVNFELETVQDAIVDAFGAVFECEMRRDSSLTII